MALAAAEGNPLSAFLRNEDLEFIGMMHALVTELGFQGVHLPKDRLTIVDVGARNMLYGVALELWALQQAKKVRVIAVDPEYCSPEGGKNFFPPHASEGLSGIEQLASYVEEALPKLKSIGVERIDIITLFNPNPLCPLPNVASIAELCKGTPVIGAIDRPIQYSIDHLVKGLSWQGYTVTCQPHNASHHMKQSYIFDYNPVFVALPTLSV